MEEEKDLVNSQTFLFDLISQLRSLFIGNVIVSLNYHKNFLYSISCDNELNIWINLKHKSFLWVSNDFNTDYTRTILQLDEKLMNFYLVDNDRIAVIKTTKHIILIKLFGKNGNLIILDQVSHNIFIAKKTIKADQDSTRLKLEPALPSLYIKSHYTIVLGEEMQGKVLVKWPKIIEDRLNVVVDKSIIDIMIEYAFSYYKCKYVNELRAELLEPMQLEYNSLQKKIRSNLASLNEFNQADKYSRLADNIMANLHMPMMNQIIENAIDIYTSDIINIEIKKKLNPQDYAGTLYKKAKNYAKELDFKRIQLAQNQIREKQLEQKIQHYVNEFQLKNLKRITNRTEKEAEDSFKKYDEYLFMNFKIKVGKNAEGNDDIRRLSKKDDLWFHAKDVAGSHAIISNKQQQNYPKELIEFVASIVLLKSKNVNASLAPVSYTALKYVRKPKGAKPGQVIVSKESTVLIGPANKEEIKKYLVA